MGVPLEYGLSCEVVGKEVMVVASQIVGRKRLYGLALVVVIDHGIYLLVRIVKHGNLTAGEQAFG